MKFKTVLTSYNRFFYEPIPATSLGIFRILFSLVILVNALLLYPDLKTWFSEVGVLPLQVARDTLPGVRINVFNLLPTTDSSLYGLFWAYVASILFLMVGLFSRTATFFVFVFTVSFTHRNVFILNSGDTMMRCLLFFLLFAPSGKTFSLDRLIKVFRGTEKQEDAFFIPWPQRLMQYQVAVMYLATVLWKLRGEMWVEGTAVFMTSHLEEFQRFPMPEFTKTLWYSKIATYYALFVEFALAVLIWFREFRYPVLMLGVFLHLGLEYAMNVPVFQWVTLSTYILFVEQKKLLQLQNYFEKVFSTKTVIFFDGNCGFCMRSVEVIQHLDLLKRIEFKNFKNNEVKKLSHFPFSRAEHEVLTLVGENWLGGYDAFRVIFKKLPITIFFTPLLYIPPVPQAGRLVYKWIAKNRHFLSAKLMSKNSVCKIK